MSFFITLSAVATMLLYAVPAYALGKAKIAKSEHLPVLAVVLLYICTPAIVINSFQKLTFSPDSVSGLVIYLLLSFALQALMMGGAWLIIRKSPQKRHRIAAIATSLGNCGFFGIPLLKALLPDNPEAVIYSALFSIAMNTIAFTFGSLLISGDKKYVKVKKIFLNPATISVAVALVIFIFSIPIEPNISSMIGVTGRMATPLSMLIMGMRLGTMKIRSLFTDIRVYATIAVTMIVMPLIAFACVFFLPLPSGLKMTFYIVTACPAASVVLNFSELVGEGQKEAASIVLMSTMMSVVTMPVMMLMLPLLAGV